MGKQTGPPVLYRWYPTYLGLMIMPWLLACLAVFLPRNRSLTTWWIATPVLFLMLSQEIIFGWLEIDREFKAILSSVVFILLYSITLYWLLLPYLSVKRKWLVFLKQAPLFLLTSAVALFFVSYNLDISGDERDYYLVGTGTIALANVVVCSLQPWICRHSQALMRIILGYLFGSLAVWVVVMGVAIGLNDPQNFMDGRTLLTSVIAVLVISGITFFIHLPFLLMHFFHPHFRARLANYLK